MIVLFRIVADGQTQRYAFSIDFLAQTAALFRRILEDSEDPAYLLIAMSALGKMKDGDAIGLLERIAGSDVPDSVRNTARKTIDAIRAEPEAPQ